MRIRTLLMLMLLSAGPCLAQETPPGSQQSATEPQQPVPAAQQPETAPPETTITVPEGTRIQLALANPIRRRDAHVGDTVRAVSTFPVTVGQDLAIPQGAYFEGRIARVGKHGPTRFDGLQIEFRQMFFSNGYNVALDGSVIDAKAMAPSTGLPGAAATPGLMENSLQQGPTPTPPPLPQVGPPKGPIIAGTLGGMVAVTITGIILAHRHVHEDVRDFDTGFQFEIVLQAPLTLDRAGITAALNSSRAN